MHEIQFSTNCLVIFVCLQLNLIKHMKKLLLFLLPFLSVAAFGQQKVYHRDKFDTEILPKKDAETKYPDLRTISKIKGIVGSQIDEKKINNDFMRAAIRQNKSIIKLIESKNLPIEIYLNKSGVIDYIVYGYSLFDNRIFNGKKFVFDTLDTQQTALFLEVAENFRKNYQYSSKNTESNFSMNIGLGLGKGQKKVSKKYISTLEMAENCEQPDTVKTLMLNRLYLMDFPEVIFKFKNLEKLDLADNYIQEIPKKIWTLEKLKLLSLSGNYIDYSKFKFKKNKHIKDLNLQYTGLFKMPKSIKRNRSLEVLFIGNNEIKFARNDFKQMSNLKALNLYNVRTSTLPKSIGKLKKLEELDLYYNDLQFLPKDVCQLPKLKTLAVANNQLLNLPEEINKMSSLQTLYAHHNRLNTLPNLPNLKLLDIGYNLFKVFPEQVYQLKDLEEFDITHNEIMEIPEGLVALDKLQKVFIRGNEFYKTDVPDEKLTKLTDSLEKRQVMVR